MTGLDSLLAAGLSQEEAEMVLAKRRQSTSGYNSRLARARAKLEAAHKKTGVQPVSAEGDELVKGYDPDADVGVQRFYENKGGSEPAWARFGRGGEKPDPDGWEDPP